MYEKKKRPYMTFLFLLIPVLALSYLVGCFFNVQENLLYILVHPFSNWWDDKSILYVNGIYGMVHVYWMVYI